MAINFENLEDQMAHEAEANFEGIGDWQETDEFPEEPEDKLVSYKEYLEV